MAAWGFFLPGQIHILEVSFADVHPVLPCLSWFSLVTSQFPLCCCRLTSWSGVVHSQDVSQPPEPSFFYYIFQFPRTTFLYNVFIFDLIPQCNPKQSPLLLFFIFCDWRLVMHHTVELRWKATHKAWFSPLGWYCFFPRCLLVSPKYLPLSNSLSQLPVLDK